jgi:hypothetical protein
VNRLGPGGGVDKGHFLENLVEASVIEDGFVFLNDNGELPPPKKTSTAAQVGIAAGIVAATVAANVLVGGNVRVFTPRPLIPGSQDHNALVGDLSWLKTVSQIVGVRICHGAVVLRLSIDADILPIETIIGRFAVIHEYAFRLCRYSESYAGSPHPMIITQGAILFSEHKKAKQFAEQFVKTCIHRPSSFRVTQPWIIDLDDEVVIKCVNVWQLGHTCPLNSKKMLVRLFQKRPAKQH